MTTVREDLVTALEAMLTPCPPETHVVGPDGECPECDVEKQARAALDRARAEPESPGCKSAGYLLPCDTSCPCYEAGAAAQREPAGGGTV